MQRLVKLLLFLVLLCFVPSLSPAQKSRRTTRKQLPPPICKIASVPNGMVVVGYKRNSACSDGSELLVKRPESGDIICAESPVPPRFSIVTEAQGNLLGTCPNKVFLIQGDNSASVIARPTASPRPATERRTAPRTDNSAIERAFASRASDIQVEGEGTVVRLLPDDLDGDRHQRFLVQLASGQTLLMAHNIDIAPRIDALRVGDSVRFYGGYVWNAKGGVIHWTHRDPQGRHVAGWIKHNGRTFQ